MSELLLKFLDDMTWSLIRTRHLGRRYYFTHFVETFDYQHRDISRQLQDLVPLGFVDERFHQFLAELVRIEISDLELLNIREGENDG